MISYNKRSYDTAWRNRGYWQKYFYLKEAERENIEQKILSSNPDVSLEKLWVMDDRELVDFQKKKLIKHEQYV